LDDGVTLSSEFCGLRQFMSLPVRSERGAIVVDERALTLL